MIRSAADAVLHKIFRDSSGDLRESSLRDIVEEIDLTNDTRLSPIHMVVLHLEKEVSLEKQVRLNFGEIDKPDWSGRTPLMWSSMRKDAKAVSTLLRSKANTAVIDKQGRTALHHAARRCSPQCASKLLKADSAALVNARDSGGCTPIYWTSTSKDPLDLLVHILVQSGADVDYPDYQGRTPLHHAARLNNSEMAGVLLDNGANVNTRTKAGESPADAAAAAGNKELEKAFRHVEEKPGAIARRNSDAEGGLAVFEDPVETLQERGHDL